MNKPLAHALVFFQRLGLLALPAIGGDRAKAPSNAKRPRVIVSTDFPPIGVVESGDVPDTRKSAPEDMQSMVQFLLYTNEFNVEGLIASAGTFAMEAHKTNILDVVDRYEHVHRSLLRRER